MKIIEDNSVTLKRVRFRFERSRICINGHRNWFTLGGITLEKAIQINAHYLLFVSTNEGSKYHHKTITFEFRNTTYSIEVLDKPIYHWLDHLSGKKNDQSNYFSMRLFPSFQKSF